MAQSWGPQSHYHWGSEEKSEKIKDYLTEGRTYVQRDLEDQIAEEYRAQGREYQRIDTNNSDNMSSSTIPQIVIQDVLDLLKRGYTRLAKDDKGYGSIQHHYGLTPGQIVKLFREPELKAKKTIAPSFIVVRRETTAPTEAEVLSTGSFAPVQDVMVTSAAAVPTVTGATREELFS